MTPIPKVCENVSNFSPFMIQPHLIYSLAVKIDPEDDVRASESFLSSRDASTVRTSNSGEEEDKNLANALDLSESEEDEELEDLVDDFLASNQTDEVRLLT